MLYRVPHLLPRWHGLRQAWPEVCAAHDAAATERSGRDDPRPGPSSSSRHAAASAAAAVGAAAAASAGAAAAAGLQRAAGRAGPLGAAGVPVRGARARSTGRGQAGGVRTKPAWPPKIVDPGVEQHAADVLKGGQPEPHPDCPRHNPRDLPALLLHRGLLPEGLLRLPFRRQRGQQSGSRLRRAATAVSVQRGHVSWTVPRPVPECLSGAAAVLRTLQWVPCAVLSGGALQGRGDWHQCGHTWH
mmetsp:Transcript_100401/g.313772  ORF Transcript_100401/g.313772 Transcript_100401/m.313772 type:complete len:244 (-) Transcript_100401:219-950(-)